MMLGHCLTGDHANCPGEIQKFIHVPARRGKRAGIEYIDEYLVCQCSKRSCKCYVPAKDRDKPKKRKKKT